MDDVKRIDCLDHASVWLLIYFYVLGHLSRTDPVSQKNTDGLAFLEGFFN